MAPTGANSSVTDTTHEKGTGDVIADLWQLVRDYAKQETIDPLRSIGRFLGLGLLGAVLLALGVFFAAMAILRGIQAEGGSQVTGSWNFLPYLAAFIGCVLVAGLAARSIKKPVRDDKARP